MVVEVEVEMEVKVEVEVNYRQTALTAVSLLSF